MSVINFECNKIVGKDGKGNFVFIGEVDCIYFFIWDMKYVCVKEKEDFFCGVVDGKKCYDLFVLVCYVELE